MNSNLPSSPRWWVLGHNGLGSGFMGDLQSRTGLGCRWEVWAWVTNLTSPPSFHSLESLKVISVALLVGIWIQNRAVLKDSKDLKY